MIKWCDRNWMTQESWGVVHPDKPNAYYDLNAVHVDEDNTLHLLSYYSPKFFSHIGKVADFATGMVCCMDRFHFGTYTVKAKFPSGKNLWPAIWLYNLHGWESEIDIVEGYSNVFNTYHHANILKYPSFYKLDSNFHYHNPLHEWVGTKRYTVKNPTKNFIEFKMVWTDKFIRLYADNKLHRELNGDVMRHYQEPMRFIISNGVQANGKPILSSDFMAKDFKYIPHR